MAKPPAPHGEPSEPHARGPSAKFDKVRRQLRSVNSTRLARGFRLVGLVVMAACAVLLGVWFALDERETERAARGVWIADLDVAGLDRPQIEAHLKGWAEPRATRHLPLTLAGKPLMFEPKSVGFICEGAPTATRALTASHAGGRLARLTAFIARRFRPQRVEPEIHFDPASLRNVLDDWQSQIPDPPFEGGLAIEGSRVSPTYPHPGTRLDHVRVAQQLRDAIVTGASGTALATRREGPRVSRSEFDRMLADANSRVSSDVELVTRDGAHRLVLRAAQVGSLLRVKADADHGTLALECSPEAMKSVLDPERPALERAPQNARFVIGAKGDVHVEAGFSGAILDDHWLARATCDAAASADKKGELRLSAGAEPALTTEAAARAGVKGLVSSFTTRHACCQPRVQNIHHIADLLDETLVWPGETYSVNRSIGPRTTKNGFRAAPSIEDGDMVDTVGGGVSQFATTLFNALFYGGYDILERQPHSYWFTRYPMGYDATLSYPHPDIAFKNDTAAAALIKAEYSDTSITVKIYGDNGGRRVRAEVSPRQNIVLPPLELIPNPRLDADREKTREGGMIGWTVVVKRTVSFADGTTKEEHRKVTYRPRARRVEVHPCRIPEGQPGHTGERCPKPDKDDPASDAGEANPRTGGSIGGESQRADGSAK